LCAIDPPIGPAPMMAMKDISQILINNSNRSTGARETLLVIVLFL